MSNGILTPWQIWWLKVAAERTLGCNVQVRQLRSTPDVIQILKRENPR